MLAGLAVHRLLVWGKEIVLCCCYSLALRPVYACSADILLSTMFIVCLRSLNLGLTATGS